jgi:hypothetical protein
MASAGLFGTACDVHGVSQPGSLSALSVSPNPQSLRANGTQQFVATGSDFDGRAVAANATWSVVAGGGSISPTGMFTAGPTAGTFASTVKATSGTLSATATVIVTVGPLASITVTPNPDSLGVGTTRQFIATGKDSSGNVVAITPTWAIVAAGGTIDSTTGLFTAGSALGTYTNTVRASAGGVSGFATVVVTAGPLASITVTPNPDTLLVGATRQFTAAGRDAAGNVVAITPSWTVVNGGGTIGATSGQFIAGTVTGAFPNTVKATSGSISGSATVNVVAVLPPVIPPVNPPVIPPGSPSLIDLGTAAPNGIMAGTAVTCVSNGLVSADVSISAGSTLTGFGPCVITGVKHLGDAVAAKAQVDLTQAYNTLAGLPCSPSNAIVGNLGGTTKAAGVYCTASGIGVTGTLTLDGGGDPNAQFVFQAGTSLTTAGNIVLINGATAANVWWQVGSSATIGTSSHWQGNIVSLTSITLVDNATLIGRALARNGAVTLGTNNVITLP